MLNLSISTPLVPMFLDLSQKTLQNEMGYKQLMFWHRLWSINELTPYKAETIDLLKRSQVNSIPLFRCLKNLLKRLGMEEYWTSPEKLGLITKCRVKKFYWDGIMEVAKLVGTLTQDFINFKFAPFYEETINEIVSPLARKLFIQYRFKTLPTKLFCKKWCSNVSVDDQCPACNACSESIVHLLFFCPHYKNLRTKWILPLCRLVSPGHYLEAMRILATDTRRVVVFGLARFWYALWIKRSKCIT